MMDVPGGNKLSPSLESPIDSALPPPSTAIMKLSSFPATLSVPPAILELFPRILFCQICFKVPMFSDDSWAEIWRVSPTPRLWPVTLYLACTRSSFPVAFYRQMNFPLCPFLVVMTWDHTLGSDNDKLNGLRFHTFILSVISESMASRITVNLWGGSRNQTLVSCSQGWCSTTHPCHQAPVVLIIYYITFDTYLFEKYIFIQYTFIGK